MVEYEVGNVEQRVPKDLNGERPIEVLFHDESTFQANDAEQKCWVLHNQHKLRKKGQGRGLHRSDFLNCSIGWLPEGGVGINYGKAHDGYWTGKDVCNQVSSSFGPFAFDAHADSILTVDSSPSLCF